MTQRVNHQTTEYQPTRLVTHLSVHLPACRIVCRPACLSVVVLPFPPPLPPPCPDLPVSLPFRQRVSYLSKRLSYPLSGCPTSLSYPLFPSSFLFTALPVRTLDLRQDDVRGSIPSVAKYAE